MYNKLPLQICKTKDFIYDFENDPNLIRNRNTNFNSKIIVCNNGNWLSQQHTVNRELFLFTEEMDLAYSVFEQAH